MKNIVQDIERKQISRSQILVPSQHRQLLHTDSLNFMRPHLRASRLFVLTIPIEWLSRTHCSDEKFNLSSRCTLFNLHQICFICFMCFSLPKSVQLLQHVLSKIGFVPSQPGLIQSDFLQYSLRKLLLHIPYYPFST